MKNNVTYLLLIFAASFLVACDRNEMPTANAGKIPIDSLYFSCKIDGETLVMESPSTTMSAQSAYVQRLYKLPYNSADSVIYGREYSYCTDNYDISIGFSECFLLDTTLVANYAFPDCKSDLFKTGDGAVQYFPPFSDNAGATSMHSGFYITILDKTTMLLYKSYVEKSSAYDNLDVYDTFRANSSFKIVSSIQLNTGIYSDYQNTWFQESNFECVLFNNNISNSQISTKIITDGVIRGCF